MGLVWPVADRPVVGRFLSPLGYNLGCRLRRPASEGSCVEVGAWRSVSEFSNPLRPLPLLGPPPWGGAGVGRKFSVVPSRGVVLGLVLPRAAALARAVLGVRRLRRPACRVRRPAVRRCSSCCSCAFSCPPLPAALRRPRRSSPRRWQACPLPAVCCALSVPARTHTQRESTGEKTRLVA